MLRCSAERKRKLQAQPARCGIVSRQIRATVLLREELNMMLFIVGLGIGLLIATPFIALVLGAGVLTRNTATDRAEPESDPYLVNVVSFQPSRA
mgnify:CR=1 FL=1